LAVCATGMAGAAGRGAAAAPIRSRAHEQRCAEERNQNPTRPSHARNLPPLRPASDGPARTQERPCNCGNNKPSRAPEIRPRRRPDRGGDAVAARAAPSLRSPTEPRSPRRPGRKPATATNTAILGLAAQLLGHDRGGAGSVVAQVRATPALVAGDVRLLLLQGLVTAPRAAGAVCSRRR